MLGKGKTYSPKCWFDGDLHCPRDPGSPSENGFMEPKYLAFRFGDCTPLRHPLSFGEPGSQRVGKKGKRNHLQQNHLVTILPPQTRHYKKGNPLKISIYLHCLIPKEMGDIS